MESINIFKQYPDCTSNRVKFRGILSDVFPTERVKINLILNAYDEGIIDEIDHSIQLDATLFDRMKIRIINSYGISEKNAEWAINYWFEKYGVAVCNKSRQDVRKPLFPCKSAPIFTPQALNGFIDISKLKDGEKIPKSFITTDLNVGDDIKLTHFSYSARKIDDYSDEFTVLKFTGEYTGKCVRCVLMLIMLYNANDNLIAVENRTGIDKNFSGTETFSVRIFVPKDEYLSKIVIKLVPDPVYG